LSSPIVTKTLGEADRRSPKPQPKNPPPNPPPTVPNPPPPQSSIEILRAAMRAKDGVIFFDVSDLELRVQPNLFRTCYCTERVCMRSAWRFGDASEGFAGDDNVVESGDPRIRIGLAV